MILQEILSLLSGCELVHQKDFHTGQICKKDLLSFEKKIFNKNKHTLFCETFFRYQRETDVNNVLKKKIRIHYVLKKLLVNTTIAFTSIYFESYYKIPARSNKSIL